MYFKKVITYMINTHDSRAGEQTNLLSAPALAPDFFQAAPAPNFFSKRLRLLFFSSKAKIIIAYPC